MERWPHQEAAFQFAKDKPASMLAMAMGTGKSLVTVDLCKEWDAQRILILCPVSVMAVWRREFAKWGDGKFAVLVLDKGTVADKQHAAEGASKMCPGPLVVVLNYESAWRKPFGEWAEKQWWDVVILDESHRCKAHNTAVSKFTMKLADRAKRRLCLTGTPMPHSPLDVFGQYRFLDWRLFGKRWTPFKHSYAVMGNPSVPQMITSYRNLDMLQERFGRIAYQVSADVLGLPPSVHHVRTFKLDGMAARIYRDLERDFCAELELGIVTAANALVKTLRLRQVVSGFVQPDETDHVEHLHSGKAELLADLLEDIGPKEPVVVFCEFQHDLKHVERVAVKLGRRYGEISGRTKCGLTKHGTMNPEVDVVGVQYQSGGVGIDLTRARYAVYYSPTYNLGNYDQSLARLARPGQKGTVHFYHLVAEGTVDEIVYKALEAKRNVVEGVLAALRARQDGQTH